MKESCKENQKCVSGGEKEQTHSVLAHTNVKHTSSLQVIIYPIYLISLCKRKKYRHYHFYSKPQITLDTRLQYVALTLLDITICHMFSTVAF